MKFPDNYICQLNEWLLADEIKISEYQDAEKKCFPLFIIGAPRSGTTLIYQALITRYKVEYPSNLIAKFWNNPIAGYALQKSIVKENDYSSNFASYDGFSDNAFMEPHEFGYFWGRWFPDKNSHYSSPNTKVSADLSRTIKGLMNVSQNSWVFKNLTLGLKILLIKRIFPAAKFIVVIRDIYNTAVSLMNGRIRRYGNKDSWWSLIPQEIARIRKMSAEEQVVAQVYFTYKQIQRDIVGINDNDWAVLYYEEFCKSPTEYFANKISKLNLEKKNTLPERFPIKMCRKHDNEIPKYICKYNFKELDDFFKSH